MKGITLLEKYPVSAELIKAWFLEKMIESFKDENVPSEFKDFMREQGIDNDKVGTLIDVNPRNLFDVFDDNDIHISVTYGNHNYENDNLGELHYCATVNNSETVTYCLRRKDAETSAIEVAFEILENKLSPKEEEIN